MLELLLKLIDHLIELSKYRLERQSKVFKEIFEPCFADLEKVHSDYLAMFAEIERMLPAADSMASGPGYARLHECAERLRQRRIEFEPVRVKLAIMIRQVLGGRYGRTPNAMSTEATAFLKSLVDYFPSGYVTALDAGSTATVLYGVLRSGSEPVEEGVIVEYGHILPELVRATIAESRSRWLRVCSAFADLKAAALKD